MFRLIFTLDEIAADVIMRKPGMIKLIVRRMEKTEPNDHPNAVRVLFDLITVTGVVCNSSENIGTLILEEGHDTLRRIAVCPCMPFSLSSKALRCIECIEWTWENEQVRPFSITFLYFALIIPPLRASRDGKIFFRFFFFFAVFIPSSNG